MDFFFLLPTPPLTINPLSLYPFVFLIPEILCNYFNMSTFPEIRNQEWFTILSLYFFCFIFFGGGGEFRHSCPHTDCTVRDMAVHL